MGVHLLQHRHQQGHQPRFLGDAPLAGLRLVELQSQAPRRTRVMWVPPVGSSAE